MFNLLKLFSDVLCYLVDFIFFMLNVKHLSLVCCLAGKTCMTLSTENHKHCDRHTAQCSGFKSWLLSVSVMLDKSDVSQRCITSQTHTHTHYSVHEIICSCVSVWSVQEGLILGESRIEEQVTISDSQADHIHIEEVYSKLDTVAHSKTSSLSHYDHLYFFNRYPEAHRLPQTERVSTAGQAITSLTPLTQTPLPNC